MPDTMKLPLCPEADKPTMAPLARNLCIAYTSHSLGVAMATEERKPNEYDEVGALWYALARYLFYSVPAAMEERVLTGLADLDDDVQPS